MRLPDPLQRLCIAVALAAASSCLLACTAPAAAPPAASVPGEAAAEAAAEPAGASGFWDENYPIFTQGDDWAARALGTAADMAAENSQLSDDESHIPVPFASLDATKLDEYLDSQEFPPFNQDILGSGDTAGIFDLDRPTTFVIPGAGALVQFVSLRRDAAEYSLMQLWEEQGRAPMLVGAWVVHQPIDVAVLNGTFATVAPGQYAVVLDSLGDLRFNLIGEGGSALEGNFQVRSTPYSNSFVFLLRMETCFASGGLAACLLVELPGFEKSEGYVEAAAQTLRDQDLLPADAAVNSEDVFGDIYDRERRRQCAAALQVGEPQTCEPDVITAAVASTPTDPSEPPYPPSDFKSIVWGIGILNVISDIDNFAINEAAERSALPAGSYRLDLFERQVGLGGSADLQLAQLVSSETVAYVGARRFQPIEGEVIEPEDSGTEQPDHRVLFDAVIWTYCSYDEGHVKCNSGEWKWNVCLLSTEC